MKAGLVASFIAAATAAELDITWSDCGAKHATTKNVQPASLPLGVETEIIGSGTVDEDVSGGTYDTELTAGGGLIDSHFTGNNCEAKTFDLPLGIGSLTWEGLTCPLKAGDADIKFKVKLASSLPAAIATSDINLKANDQNGEDLLCVKLHLQKAKSLLGDDEELEGPSAFMAGFLEGFLGEAKHVKACVGDSVKVAQDVQHLVADLKSKNINGTITDLQAMVTDVLDDVQVCKEIGKDLAPFLAAFKDVHGIKDLANKLKENFLAHDREIVDTLEDMLDVCTFGAPDAHKCGKDAGKELRSIVIGDQMVGAQLEDHGQVFIAGFLEGFLAGGDTKHIQACVTDSAKVAKDAQHLVADLQSKNLNKTVADVQALVTDVMEDVKACKDIGKDLKAFLDVFKGVHGIKDLANKLKENFLAHDREIVDLLEDMLDVCTFGAPDAHKCGEDAGKQMRKLVVGDTVVV